MSQEEEVLKRTRYLTEEESEGLLACKKEHWRIPESALGLERKRFANSKNRGIVIKTNACTSTVEMKARGPEDIAIAMSFANIAAVALIVKGAIN